MSEPVKKIKNESSHEVLNPKGKLINIPSSDWPIFLENEELHEDVLEEPLTKEENAFLILDSIYGDNRSNAFDPVFYRKSQLLDIFKYLSDSDNFDTAYKQVTCPYFPRSIIKE